MKPLPKHLEYAFLEKDSLLSIVISTLLKYDEKKRLVSILKNHKEAFAWKTFDIPGISPSFYKHKINFEDDAKPVIQRQRRLNPNMKEVVKKEIIKLLDAGIIYAIEDSPWISIEPTDQEKTTFTCPCGTYAYKHMPFGLCNAPATFQRCMIAIFQDMLERSMEVFMDDFSKCHFMVTEGILLGYKVSSAGLEVDKEKIDVIAKLPPPTNIKGVRIFLGHAGFYHRFIIYFSKISRLMIKLLEKDSVFDFNEECMKAFETPKEKKGLTYAQRCNFFSELKHYFWDEPYLFIACPDGMIRRCVYGSKTQKILDECHHGPTGGHYGPSTTSNKVFDAGFYWPTIFKEAHTLVQNYDSCQRSGNLSRRDEMPLNSIQAEAKALPTNDALVVINFLKKLFSRFGIPKALISDRGEKQFLQLHELDESRLQAYKNSKLYKAQTKAYHDKKLRIHK
ncbi:reverse transcriptase domain-containing protein [Tanacetum coccineum]